jgi:hypothetical protein
VTSRALLATVGLAGAASLCGCGDDGGRLPDAAVAADADLTVDYNFVPPADGDWYLLVKNSGNVTADIEVTVRLYGAMTWRWQ